MRSNQVKTIGNARRCGPEVTSPMDRDVLHTEEWVGHVGSPTDLAHKLGYEYILWNDRVYHVEAESLRDTGLTERDLH